MDNANVFWCHVHNNGMFGANGVDSLGWKTDGRAHSTGRWRISTRISDHHCVVGQFIFGMSFFYQSLIVFWPCNRYQRWHHRLSTQYQWQQWWWKLSCHWQKIKCSIFRFNRWHMRWHLDRRSVAMAVYMVHLQISFVLELQRNLDIK